MKCEKPELVCDPVCEIGEGPLWHPDESCLYFVDIPKGRLYRYVPETHECSVVHKERQIGGLTVQADGGLALFLDRGAVVLFKDGDAKTVLAGIPGEEETRFNDEIADPEGRVFVGTMSDGQRPGRLYCIERDGSYRVASDGSDTPEGGYGTPNGMGFTPDGTGLYFNDSRTNRTYLFDYDSETGSLSARRIFREGSAVSLLCPGLNGHGDGLTVDAEGRVWIAEWNGGRVVCYSPEAGEPGKPEMLYELCVPARKASCLTFGGRTYSDMYITTALLGGLRPEEGQGAGALFCAKTDVKGVPGFRSRILL